MKPPKPPGPAPVRVVLAVAVAAADVNAIFDAELRAIPGHGGAVCSLASQKCRSRELAGACKRTLDKLTGRLQNGCSFLVDRSCNALIMRPPLMVKRSRSRFRPRTNASSGRSSPHILCGTSWHPRDHARASAVRRSGEPLPVRRGKEGATPDHAVVSGFECVEPTGTTPGGVVEFGSKAASEEAVPRIHRRPPHTSSRTVRLFSQALQFASGNGSALRPSARQVSDGSVLPRAKHSRP